MVGRSTRRGTYPVAAFAVVMVVGCLLAKAAVALAMYVIAGFILISGSAYVCHRARAALRRRAGQPGWTDDPGRQARRR